VRGRSVIDATMTGPIHCGTSLIRAPARRSSPAEPQPSLSLASTPPSPLRPCLPKSSRSSAPRLTGSPAKPSPTTTTSRRLRPTGRGSRGSSRCVLPSSPALVPLPSCARPPKPIARPGWTLPCSSAQAPDEPKELDNREGSALTTGCPSTPRPDRGGRPAERRGLIFRSPGFRLLLIQYVPSLEALLPVF
jgi:hypothetical protein